MKENAPLPLVKNLFYPADPEKLTTMIDGFLKEKKRGNSKTIWIPHAAYDVCGDLMAEAFAACADSRPERIILLLPVHREPEDLLYLSSCRYWSTPTGNGILDTETALTMEEKYSFCRISSLPFEEENSFELALPFIYHLFRDIRILPIFFASSKTSFLKKGAAALNEIIKPEKDLLVISSNTSNYETQTIADNQKDELISLILQKNEIKIPEVLSAKKIAACGAPSLYMLMKAGILNPGELQLKSNLFAPDPVSSKPKGVWYSSGWN